MGIDEENMNQNKEHIRSMDFSPVAGQTQGNKQAGIQATLKQAAGVCQVLYMSFLIFHNCQIGSDLLVSAFENC